MVTEYAYIQNDPIGFPRGAVGWSAVCLFVVFPDHTSLFSLHKEKENIAFVKVIPWLVRLYMEIIHEL